MQMPLKTNEDSSLWDLPAELNQNQTQKMHSSSMDASQQSKNPEFPIPEAFKRHQCIQSPNQA